MYGLTIFEFFCGSKSQNFVCNGCHDLTMLPHNLRDVAFIAVKNVDYRCFIHDISKYKASHLLENSVLEDGGYV